jgi:hypothetical protein
MGAPPRKVAVAVVSSSLFIFKKGFNVKSTLQKLPFFRYALKYVVCRMDCAKVCVKCRRYPAFQPKNLFS